MIIPHPLRTSCALLLTESRLWRTALRVALAVLGSIGPVPSVPAAEGMIEHTLSNGLQVVLVEDHWHPLAALELLADVVRHPLFPPAEVERARTAAIAERQAKTEETPEVLLMRHLFAPGPYGRPPSGEAASTQGQESPERTLAALRSVTAEEVQRVARTYLDPHGVAVTVVGDAQALEKYAPALAQGKLPQWNSQSGAREQ